MPGYHTKRISLPDGKFIEIVVIGGDDAPGVELQAHAADVATDLATALAATETRTVRDLHLCPECASGLVYPVGWDERRSDRWSITLRCPNCEWWHTGEYGDGEVERFDDVLNEGTELLLDALRSFSRSNMQDDVERLIEAIDTGLIQPMDF